MRVISGKYKGTNIIGYDIDGTRPTQDRVKESLFGIIQEYIRDSHVLDLFSGSGNLGIEALSNYAEFSYFVDNNKMCCDTIKSNLDKVKETNYKILNTDYNDALNYFKNNSIKFDLIFLDPPYKLEVLDNILDKITSYDLLNNDGLVICEYENDTFKEDYNNLELIKNKKYGYKNIRIYRKK